MEGAVRRRSYHQRGLEIRRRGAANSIPSAMSAARLTVVLFLALWPGTSWAHAYLVKSVPAAQAVVAHPPARAELWFNERLEPAYSRVSVLDGRGRHVDLGSSH